MAVTVPKILSRLDLILPFSKHSASTSHHHHHRKAARTRSIKMSGNPLGSNAPEEAPPPPLPPKEHQHLLSEKAYNPRRETWQAIYTAYTLSLAFEDSDDSPLSSTSSSPVSGVKADLDHDHERDHTIFVARQISYPSATSPSSHLKSQISYTAVDPMSYPLPKPPRQYAPAPSTPPPYQKRGAAAPRVTTTPTSSPSRRAPLSPAEAEQRRKEALRVKALEEAQAAREEAERQLKLKEEKRAVMLTHYEEEMRRKAELEDELRRIGEEKRRREEEEIEEERRREEERMERKRVERERRVEETRRAEEWRDEVRKSQEQESLRKEQMRKGVVEQRKKLAMHLKEARRTHEGKDVLLTGWITVQMEGCVAWKRRYFRLTEDQLVLFKTAAVSFPSNVVQSGLTVLRVSWRANESVVLCRRRSCRWTRSRSGASNIFENGVRASRSSRPSRIPSRSCRRTRWRRYSCMLTQRRTR